MKHCTVCGRSSDSVELNIEGMIHHNAPLRCKDLKSCERAKKKVKKESKND